MTNKQVTLTIIFIFLGLLIYVLIMANTQESRRTDRLYKGLMKETGKTAEELYLEGY